ncbi:MAG TPA: hypothetical protein VFI16_05835, partial [Anaeromyxobacteraceae bacterium]|nr:hypothetical protein [Anaeromyxobacteraceae bacterium]
MRPLCQREGASCGACCGLYNRRDPSRAALEATMRRRTEWLAVVPRSEGAFRIAAARLAPLEPPPLFASVRVCPLLGFLDAAESRIGCLAHPAVTGGPDLRDAGVYGAQTCESFMCPSHAWLSEEEAELVALACGDAHLYGLVVTDVPFLRAALSAVAEGMASRVELRHLSRPAFRDALRALLALKEELAPGSNGLYGAFRPGPSG